MSTVSLPAPTLSRCRDLFLLYSQKNAFKIDEYADAGAVYKRLVSAVESTESDGSAEVSETDVNYVLSAINVCSQRVPTEVQNYKPIAELTESLAKALKPADEEETKEE